MSVSVIIATYNRDTHLEECLRVLANQPFEPSDEVIVVDNGSTDATRHVVAEFARDARMTFHALSEPVAGKSHALARALTAARGDVVAFIDDDVIVHATWLNSIRAAFRDPDLMLLAGRVDPRWECLPPKWLRWCRDDGTFDPMTAPLALLHYGREQDLGARTALGANMAIRRAALDAVGGFPTHLGKRRGTLLSGEDHDLCQRIVAQGLRARYVPGVRVRHWVPAARMRFAYYVRWYFWSGITNAALGSSGAPSKYWMKRAILEAMTSAANAALFRWTASVEHLTQAALAAGVLAERWRIVTLPGLGAREEAVAA